MPMSQINPLDEVLFVKVTVYTSGALSISGHIGDPQLCIELLQQAIDEIRNQQRKRALIVVPPSDTQVKEYAYPVKPLGDMPPSDWGDR